MDKEYWSTIQNVSEAVREKNMWEILLKLSEKFFSFLRLLPTFAVSFGKNSYALYFH